MLRDQEIFVEDIGPMKNDMWLTHILFTLRHGANTFFHGTLPWGEYFFRSLLALGANFFFSIDFSNAPAPWP